MAVDCCHKEYVAECEILVCVDAPATYNRTFYSRLRFGLLASSWLPRPLGIFLWSALHVMLLIIGGPVFWVLGLLITFLFFSVFLFGYTVIFFGGFCVVYGVFAVAVNLIRLVVQLIRFCWSLVAFLACHEPIVAWKGGACLPVLFWKDLKDVMMEMFWGLVPIGVPCMSRSLYKETKDGKFETWARWCEEVVHMHDAIAL